jgi:serine/threonine protein kinase
MYVASVLFRYYQSRSSIAYVATVAADRSSVTSFVGTWGYIAPDYAMSNARATRLADIYAFGGLILELVTGGRAGRFHLTMATSL